MNETADSVDERSNPLDRFVTNTEFNTAPIPAPLPETWSVCVASGDLVAQAERLEYEVFVEIGFCEPSDQHRSMEYEPWREPSSFQVVLDDAGAVAAAIRTIVGEYDDLPVGKFARETGSPPNPVIEFASLAVPADRRQRGLAEALYRGVFTDAVRRGLGGLTAIGEDWLLALLNGTYGYGFHKMGPSRWYMGGDCFPMGVEMLDLITRLAQHQPAMLSYLAGDLVMDDVARPDLVPVFSQFLR